MSREQEAQEVLTHLNNKAKRNFKISTKATSGLIKARLKDYQLQGLLYVIDDKCTQWIGDPKMEKYLTPNTLFAKKNFDKYIIEVEYLSEDPNLSPQQQQHRAYLKTPKWASIRDKVVRRSNGTCEGCGDYLNNRGHVHHTTYDNLGDEFLFQLRYLCENCHSRLHKEAK